MYVAVMAPLFVPEEQIAEFVSKFPNSGGTNALRTNTRGAECQIASRTHLHSMRSTGITPVAPLIRDMPKTCT